MRRAMLSLLIVVGLNLGTPTALAASCARESAGELERRGDVSATGIVSSVVPGGFIFAADRVYKGNLPGHVLVLGQYHPPEVGTSSVFVVMRFHLPGVYSMDICDGRSLGDANLGPLGAARPPSPDLPIAQALVGVLLVIALLLLVRRGRGTPAAPAAAAAY